MHRLIAVALLGVLAAGVYFRLRGESAKLACETLHVEASGEAFLVNGQPDWGYQVKVLVRNAADVKGFFGIQVSLSTSEGSFERQQEYVLEAGETQSLNYSFHEPTIGASNVQPRAACVPIRPF
jgi:hypothetical protein